jgi:hypothetical protein
MKRFTIYCGFFLLILLSCENDVYDTATDLTLNDLRVVKFRKQGDLSYASAENLYILKFLNDTTFEINLDINGCGGKYKIISNGNIELEPLYCTEIFCDSDFADDLIQLIPKMTKYYKKENEMIFEGQGKIVFKNY